jgi:hypothetical protein
MKRPETMQALKRRILLTRNDYPISYNPDAECGMILPVFSNDIALRMGRITNFVILRAE